MQKKNCRLPYFSVSRQQIDDGGGNYQNIDLPNCVMETFSA